MFLVGTTTSTNFPVQNASTFCSDLHIMGGLLVDGSFNKINYTTVENTVCVNTFLAVSGPAELKSRVLMNDTLTVSGATILYSKLTNYQ